MLATPVTKERIATSVGNSSVVRTPNQSRTLSMHTSLPSATVKPAVRQTACKRGRRAPAGNDKRRQQSECIWLPPGRGAPRHLSGLLVGIIPALVSWGLAFTFWYFAGVTIPSFGVAVLAIALAGVNGGLLAFADKSITSAPNAERVVTAIPRRHDGVDVRPRQGRPDGSESPRRLSLDKNSVSGRSLRTSWSSSAVAAKSTSASSAKSSTWRGTRPLGGTRAEIRGEGFTFPADLRISELEARFEERLTKTFDLGDAAVSIDERGRASVVAARPSPACRSASTTATTPSPSTRCCRPDSPEATN